MYNATEWRDKVVDQSGQVIQQGTLQDQTHFNNMESGILDTYIADKMQNWGRMQDKRLKDDHVKLMDSEVLGETLTVTLTNTASLPFNSTVDSPVTVALQTNRKNLFYTVETEVVSHTGNVGTIAISAKALNGFKVSFDGSGTSVKLNIRVKGGMA